MFSQRNLLVTRLQNIIGWYHDTADANPISLRLQLPSEEIWRLFIDGERQKNSRNLDHYLNLILLQHPLGRHFRNFSLNDAKNSKATKDQYDYLLQNLNIDYELGSNLSIQDLIDLNHDWYYFEMSEPGYLRALYRSFDLIFENRDYLDLDFILELHKNATRTVEYTNYHESMMIDETTAGQIRHVAGISFPLTINCSLDGIHEILKTKSPHAFIRLGTLYINADTPTLLKKGDIKLPKTNNHQLNTWLNLVAETNTTHELAELLHKYAINEQSTLPTLMYISRYSDNTAAYLEKTAKDYINTYNLTIKRAKHPIEKIRAIVGIIQSLEQLHVFCDANCRTLCMLLLNHLLISNGLPFCIPKNPNYFDAYSRNELIEMVIDGMEKTRKLLTTHRLHGVTTKDLMAIPTKLSYSPVDPLYFKSVIDIEERARRRINMRESSAKKRRLNDT